jgi:hypothetical protein
MSLIEKARAHYSAKEMRKLSVPEWEIDVYCTPITMAERKSIHAKAGNDPILFIVYAVINKALDKDGQKLFDLKDKVELLENCDGEIVSRIGNWVLESQDPSEHEKNS